jgi:hypothetical protein
LSHKYVARALPWLCIFLAGCVPSGLWNMVVPEQRCLDIRDPSQLPQIAIPPIPEPETVSKPIKPVDPSNLSLDEAIRISLSNSTVVRVLAGVTAVSSGQTVYEPAISNTFIDEARAMFDPNITVRNAFSRFENPPVVFDPADPVLARITGASIDNYELGLGITKKLVTGGTASFEFSDVRNRFRDTFSVLNPQGQS